jgi:hypothetical protein
MKTLQALGVFVGATALGIPPAVAGGPEPHGTLFHRILHDQGGLDFIVAVSIIGGFVIYCAFRSLIPLPDAEE